MTPEPDPQLDALPISSLEYLLVRWEQQMRRLVRFGGMLEPKQRLRILDEVSYITLLLDQMEHTVKARVEREAKAVGLIA